MDFKQFLQYVKADPDHKGCVIWTRAKSGICGDFKYAYGHFRENGKDFLTHRWIWERYNGKIPEGKCVLHSCDNPSCVNIFHLRLGTKKDNAQERNSRNRGFLPKGEKNGRAKLTKQDAQGIRAIYSQGFLFQYEIAQQYHIAPSIISDIIQNKIWR